MHKVSDKRDYHTVSVKLLWHLLCSGFQCHENFASHGSILPFYNNFCHWEFCDRISVSICIYAATAIDSATKFEAECEFWSVCLQSTQWRSGREVPCRYKAASAAYCKPRRLDGRYVSLVGTPVTAGCQEFCILRQRGSLAFCPCHHAAPQEIILAKVTKYVYVNNFQLFSVHQLQVKDHT